MSPICIFLAAVAVLFVSANAGPPAPVHGEHPQPHAPQPHAPQPHLPHAPPAHPVCFKKIRKCCFKFAPCGFVTKKVGDKTRCDFKKCAKVCKPACKLVPHRHQKKTCAYSKVHKGRECGHFLTYKHHKPAVTRKCFPLYGFKKDCYGKVDVVYRKVCKHVCAVICKLEKALCTKTKEFQYVKFCAKLGCSGVKIEGSTAAPPPYVGKDAKLVKKIPGHREILGVEPVEH